MAAAVSAAAAARALPALPLLVPLLAQGGVTRDPNPGERKRSSEGGCRVRGSESEWCGVSE